VLLVTSNDDDRAAESHIVTLQRHRQAHRLPRTTRKGQCLDPPQQHRG
jgi:hypothetical protein